MRLIKINFLHKKSCLSNTISTLDKKLLKKGIRFITISISCCFIGPIMLYQSFKNQEHPLYFFVLSIGLLFLFLAIYNGFKGIMAIVSAFIGERKKRNI